MSVEMTRSLEELPAGLDGFFGARLECNLMASLIWHARGGRLAGAEPWFGWAHDAGGALAYFAMRTPPWPLLVTALEAAQASALVERWLAVDPEMPGVSGAPASARAVGAAWSAATGGTAQLRMSEAIHVLDRVIDPEPPAPGVLRIAAESDRGLLEAWERDFVREANLTPGAALEANRTVTRRLAGGSQLIWEHDGPASTLVLSPNVAGTVRIGPVYTPPGRRRNGYASAAVASACTRALAQGASRCMLYTDLANPTSNKIYAAVGFSRCGDWEEHDFIAPGAS